MLYASLVTYFFNQATNSSCCKIILIMKHLLFLLTLVIVLISCEKTENEISLKSRTSSSLNFTIKKIDGAVVTNTGQSFEIKNPNSSCFELVIYKNDGIFTCQAENVLVVSSESKLSLVLSTNQSSTNLSNLTSAICSIQDGGLHCQVGNGYYQGLTGIIGEDDGF